MLKLFQRNNKEPKNIEGLITQFKDLKEEVNKISAELEKLKKESKLNIQKVEIVRFNPFSEVGGDQSFSLALLDANDNGVVLTSLYTRNENRVYGKPVKNSRSQYLLSDEEIRAIETAKNHTIQTANHETKQSNNNNAAADRRNPRTH